MIIQITIPFILLAVSALCCNSAGEPTPGHASPAGPNDTLPPPYATSSVRNYSMVIGWAEGKTPVAPGGFSVTRFADGLDNPRWIYVGRNGDIFVSESNLVLKGLVKLGARLSRKIRTHHYGNSAGRITLFRDRDHDGVYESRYTFAEGYIQPFGMLILNNQFYIADTDALYAFPYSDGDTMLATGGRKILSLPAGGYNNHWTRNIITDKQGKKIYVSVGSASNVGEHGMRREERRACILEINPDGSGERIYASGLRNPVGMDWEPKTGRLWTAVNERDGLGDDLVPDYITGVKEGGFYGWPYAYFGKNIDPRRTGDMNHDLVDRTIVPDLTLGAHTASLGLAFYNGQAFPQKYRGGAFVAQHGSWNRSVLTGYKVVFIPFQDGKPSGKPEDFLTGFIADLEKTEVHGRPVCVAITADGSMLVTDDASNTVWRIAYSKSE